MKQTNISAWATAVRGNNPKEGALVHPLGWSCQPSAVSDAVPYWRDGVGLADSVQTAEH